MSVQAVDISTARFRALLARFRALLALFSLCVLWFVSGTLCAQEPDETETDTVPRTNLADQLRPGTSLVYKDPDTGEVRPIGEAPPEMVRELQERILLQKNTQPYGLQKLDVHGTVSEQFAKLQVLLRVDVHADQEWIRVPVGFESYQLTDLKHTTDVPNGRAVLEKSRLPVKNWLLHGKGTHLLELHLIGAADISKNGRWRLKIGAPTATISHLKLQLSDRAESMDLSSEQPFQIHHDEDSGNSTLETWGLSATTEISWIPSLSVTDSKVTVQASSRAKMKLDLTAASLVVEQPLSISGGSIDELNVKLPPGFGTVTINGTNAEGDEIVRPQEAVSEESAVIQFTAPVTGAITLFYDIGLDDAPWPQDLQIRIPDIAEVANETADVEIYVPVGLEVDIDQPDIRDVRQIRVETTRGPRTAVFGYRLLSSRALLQMTIRETKTFFAVVPVVSFESERNNILMTARFSITVVRGSLNEIDIIWPDFEKHQWQILHEYTELIAGDTVTKLTGFDAETMKLRFRERMSGKFEIEMQAFRPRNAGGDDDGTLLYLPDVRSPSPHTTHVSLADSDEFSLSMSDSTGKSAFPVMPPSRWPEHLKQEEKPLTVRMVDSAKEAVLLRVTPQQAEVKTAVDASLEIQHGSIHVMETVTFDVRHLDLSEIRLSLSGIKPIVRFEDTDDRLNRVETDGDEAVFALPEPKRGVFRIHIDYFSTPEIGTSGTTELPLVMPTAADAETEVTVGTAVPESLSLVTSPDWRRVYSARHSAAWRSSGRHTSLPVVLKHDLQTARRLEPGFIVMRSMMRGASLVTTLTGIYPKPVDSVLFSVPRSAEVIEAFVEGKPSSSMTYVTTDAETTDVIQVRGEIGRASRDSGSVTLVVRTPLPDHSSLFSSWRPELPKIIGAADDCNILWILGQTPDNSLVYCGTELTELGSVFTARMFGRDAADAEQQLQSVLAPCRIQIRSAVLDQAGQAAAGAGQLLTGPASGEAPLLVSLSRRVTLLLTAVVGLLIYFVFVRLRAISLITVLVLVSAAGAVIVSVVPGPGQVILVRLVPGCVIAVIAALIQRTIGSQAAVPALTAHDYDQSTIFTVEKPVVVKESPSTAGTVQQTAAESSLVSAP